MLVPAYAGEIRFIKEDWHRARRLAAEENKMLLVDFYTDWCSWCRVMDTTTFRDSAVAAFVNEHFVPLSIDAEKGLGITVAMKYRVGGYPSYGYFTSDGLLVMKSLGYQPPQEYLETLRDAVGRAGAGKFYAGVTPEVELDFPDFLLAASGGKDARKKPEPGVVDAWLGSVPSLLGEVPFTVICRFTTSQKVNDFFLANRDRFIELYGPDDVEMKVASIIEGQLDAAVDAKDPALLEKTIAMSARYGSGDEGENRRRLTMSYYRGTGEWGTYAGMVEAAIADGKMSDGGVNAAAWTLYERCDDPAVIAKAAKWMSKVVESSPTYAYLDTYAALLFRDGRKELAEGYALKAIERGKADTEDVSATEELLKKIRGGTR
jgi:hypothetical protein